RRCLVSKRIWDALAFQEPLQESHRIATNAYRYRLAGRTCRQGTVYGRIDVQHLLIQIAGLQTFIDPPFLYLGNKRHAFIHGDRKGLSAAHSAKPGGDIEGTAETT